jgi:hypothetical protein
MGYRRMESGMMKGLVVRRGSVIDELEESTGRWIYHSCMHPDDARVLCNKLNRIHTFAEADFKLSTDGNAPLDPGGTSGNPPDNR